MTTSTDKRPGAGDRVPACMGITAQGHLYASEEQTGRPVVAIVARGFAASGLVPLLAAFSPLAEPLNNRGIDLVALIGEDVEAVFEFGFQHPGGVTLVGSQKDSLAEFLDAIDADASAPEVLVLDRNQRLAGRFGGGEPGALVAAAQKAVDALPFDQGQKVGSPAPVLILPNLMEPELCRELIALHQAGPTFNSPVLTVDQRGRPFNRLANEYKRRTDLLLERDHALYPRINDIIMRRIAPEIKRCFQVTVNHTDRVLIACYPGDGGHFRRHRDNRPEIVAFRRFALSINLTQSAEGFEGGFLRLPEFNDHHYRTPSGGGIIFSVALLHEITPVVRGDRYVLVTHLHDDEGEAQWQAYRSTMASVATAR